MTRGAGGMCTMFRAAAARIRVTFPSSCLATALALVAMAPVAATNASPGPESSAVSEPVNAAPATTELPGAEAVAAAHGYFVAVGTHVATPPRPVAWVSADGLTWDEAGIVDAGPGSHMVAVTPTSDGFAALGYARDIDGAESNRILAWYSADGTSWELATIRRPALRGFDAFPAGLTDGPARGLVDGPAGLLALGSFVGQDLAGQRLWHSIDGRAWEPAVLPDIEDAVWSRVVGVPGGYLLQGQRGEGRGGDYQVKPADWRSADGETWEELPGLPSLTDLAAAPDGTVVGIDGQDIWRSSDLVTWETVWSPPAAWASPTGQGEQSTLGWVAWAGDRFTVTVTDHGACATEAEACPLHQILESADGRTWSQVNEPAGPVGIDSDTPLKDVASDGISTVWLSLAEADRPAVVWHVLNETLATITGE
jgi:hypothetical protein